MFEALRGRAVGAARLAGLASLTVPLAVGVHVAVEAVAGPAEAWPAFVLRHVYLLPAALAALVAFVAAAGVGGRDSVRRRALARAALARRGTVGSVAALFLADLVFFAATQAIEGLPIATGSLALGVLLAALASLAAAIAVVALGRTFVAIAIALQRRGSRPARLAPRSRPRATHAPRRRYSLFVSTRPPPACAGAHS